jgi:hypothetical protein
MPRVRRDVLIALTVTALTVSACGGDDGTATTSAAPTPTTAETTAAPATTTSAAPDTTTATSPSTTPATVPATTAAPTTTTDPGAIDLVVVGGQPADGLVEATVAFGTPVTITITADTADEAHLHGYDLEVDLQPGVTAPLAFTATTPGTFELELHDSLAVLLLLTVA